MNASIAIQVLPKSKDREDGRRIVDAVIAYIASTGLHYVVGPFETTLEGDLEQLMEIATECQKICVKAGSPSVMSYVKINYQPEGVWTIDDKIGKYQAD